MSKLISGTSKAIPFAPPLASANLLMLWALIGCAEGGGSGLQPPVPVPVDEGVLWGDVQTGDGGPMAYTDPAVQPGLVDAGPQASGPPCIDDPTQVAILGDSYVDWPSHTFILDLAAESGQTWPAYALGGTSMATGGLFGFIPPQFEAAISTNPDIKAIVMNGGGNDIILADTMMFPEGDQCTRDVNAPDIEDCQRIVTAAVDAAKELLQHMADVGVEDVAYMFYPHIPGGGLISGPTPNEILDYALPFIKDMCDSAIVDTEGKLTCHFVDMVPAFEGRPELFSDIFSPTGDGVHPNTEGSKVMAAEMWRTMEENCVAQPAGSACCTPSDAG